MAVVSKLLNKYKKGEIINRIMWNTSPMVPFDAFVPVVSTIIICVVSYYFLKCINTDINVRVRDATKTHNWKPIKISSKAWYCSICESLLINGIGVYCDCCGVCSDTDCIKKANSILSCKCITSKTETQLHHWVKGNLSFGAECDVCHEECSVEPGLVDYQCCWCQRAVHTKCLKDIEKECDFGPYRHLIVPPWCVQVARMKSSIHRHLLLRGVQDPGWEDWSPLIVVANRKSGNSDGALFLSEFRKVLNPAQVLDLSERPPAAALQWSVLVSPKPIILLVGGGDGTISWMLTTAYKMDLEPQPAVSIFPLGTGNDLSRVLGWGKENSSEINVMDIMEEIGKAKASVIDRWKIDITPYRHLGIRLPAKSLYMYNYFSVGVDAQVALDFHNTRDSKFYIFGNRIFNKLLYLCFGTQQVVAADCKNIQQRIELYLDGKLVELPELESIIILNIQSWGAGVNLWGMIGDTSVQSYKDGVLEVVGIYSSFHIAQLQVGLSTPHRIGQAKVVEVHLKAKAPVQVDGEPWEQMPGIIRFSLIDQATILVNKKKH